VEILNVQVAQKKEKIEAFFMEMVTRNFGVFYSSVTIKVLKTTASWI